MEAEAASRIGARMLGEIEESSLDEILACLQTSLTKPSETDDARPTNPHGRLNPGHDSTGTRLKDYPLQPLNDLVNRHYRSTQSPLLALSGRYLPLLYSLVAAIIAPPHSKAVLVIDVDGRFDVTRLLEHPATPSRPPSSSGPGPGPSPSPSDLDHVHITRPARGDPEHIAQVVASAQQFILYGAHGSRGREWWGTVVIGGGLSPSISGLGAGSGTAPTIPGGGHADVDVNASWRGWLRVDREEVRGFGAGTSVEEALADRDTRQAALDEAGWAASSVWGSFVFGRRGKEG